ncbi:hypothetical protein D3C87_782630 [compost metagenome]
MAKHQEANRRFSASARISGWEAAVCHGRLPTGSSGALVFEHQTIAFAIEMTEPIKGHRKGTLIVQSLPERALQKMFPPKAPDQVATLDVSAKAGVYIKLIVSLAEMACLLALANSNRLSRLELLGIEPYRGKGVITLLELRTNSVTLHAA